MTAPPVLTLDRGNSTLDGLLHTAAGDRRRRLRPDAVGAGLQELLGDLSPVCVGVTVVPGGLDPAAAVLAARGLRLLAVPGDVPPPLPLDYQTPETLGADRWLGCLGAFGMFGAAVVVDCGTATTVNRVDADGTFRGGCIGPGLGALRAAVAERTPALPAEDPGAAFAMPPRSTAEGVRAGLALGFCGLVERMVDAVGAGMGGTPTLVVTGGHAEDYRRRGRLPVVLVPDLVHRGLRAALEAACSS